MTDHRLPPPLARAVNIVTWLENALLVFVLAAMVLLAAAQILLRNFMGVSLEWTDQALRLLVLWVAFLGAVAASRECMVLAWQSVRYLLKSMDTGEMAFGILPVWLASSILPLAFSLIALRYGLRLVHHVRQGLGREKPEA